MHRLLNLYPDMIRFVFRNFSSVGFVKAQVGLGPRPGLCLVRPQDRPQRLDPGADIEPGIE